jgi:tetratricopeptide (TPR) repeat protein
VPRIERRKAGASGTLLLCLAGRAGVLLLAGSISAFAQTRTVPANAPPGAPPQTSQPPPQVTPVSDDAEFAASRKLLQLGKFDQAIAQLLELQAKQPATRGLSRELGIAYYKKSDYLNAAVNLATAQAENPGDQEATQLLGLSYYLGGQAKQAIPLLEKVQRWYSSANVDAAYVLGICYIQTKDYARAREAFAKMFDVGADSAASYVLTARMLLREDFGPIAEEYATKALGVDPKLPLAHQLLGELYLYQSKIPEATAQFQAELVINPGYAAAYYKLADAESRLEKYDDAEKLLQRSIWLDPTSTGPYILLGKVLEKKGEAELSVRALQRALSMDPNNPIPHHLLGQTYRDLGRAEDAERELKLAEQLQSHQNEKPE